jgi:hypothetical protein
VFIRGRHWLSGMTSAHSSLTTNKSFQVLGEAHAIGFGTSSYPWVAVHKLGISVLVVTMSHVLTGIPMFTFHIPPHLPVFTKTRPRRTKRQVSCLLGLDHIDTCGRYYQSLKHW